MKIAILGTRGIPNKHGGFEQFAESLGLSLVKKGHTVTVYNTSVHPFKAKDFKGIKIIHKYCPENRIGSLAHFYYDWACSYDAYKKDYDVVYHAGYQSAALGIKWFAPRSKSIWVTNMDGLEWKRDKWSRLIKWATKRMEKIAVKHSDHLISDNIGIQKYFFERYNVKSTYLPYGADIPTGLKPANGVNLPKIISYNYYLIIARLEPENNIERILKGYVSSKSKHPILLVGSLNTKHGDRLKKKYSHNKNIKFVGAIYNKKELDGLRKHAKLYFHGHTVGGTNPSLLEAMAAGAAIVAYKNIFNSTVLENNGVYFSSSNDIKNHILRATMKKEIIEEKRDGAISAIKLRYSWDKITTEYLMFFNEARKKK